MASVWIYQDTHQVQKKGAEEASWYVGYLDPEGKRRCRSCGPGADGKRNAEKLRKKLEAELLTGTYQSGAKKTWPEFRKEYEQRIAAGMEPRTRKLTLDALGHFERLVKPKWVAVIKTQTVDEFTALRRRERGKKKGESISPATVNKELRHLRAVLNVAHEWGYLPKAPKVRMVKEPGKLPTYVTADDFARIYDACGQARLPADLPYPAADWWRGLLMTAYMTGWRIGELLAMKREDLDRESGTVVIRAEDNKGRRSETVKLHPLVLEHLDRLPSFDPHVFPWNHHRRTLDVVFRKIQEAAGVHLPCRKQHEHTPACHVYGFHDLRRAFATMNAARLSADALQALMRHQSYQTTQRYIHMARQLDEAVEGLFVPDLKAKGKEA